MLVAILPAILLADWLADWLAGLLAGLLVMGVGSKISDRVVVEQQFNRRTHYCHAIAPLRTQPYDEATTGGRR